MISHLSKDEQRAKVQEHLFALMEFFDAVQILASSSTEEGGTSSTFCGAGNHYARQGMAHEFIKDDTAESNAYKIAGKMPKPPPEDGETWKDPNE